jgi:hypothetical protein
MSLADLDDIASSVSNTTSPGAESTGESANLEIGGATHAVPIQASSEGDPHVSNWQTGDDLRPPQTSLSSESDWRLEDAPVARDFVDEPTRHRGFSSPTNRLIWLGVLLFALGLAIGLHTLTSENGGFAFGKPRINRIDGLMRIHMPVVTQRPVSLVYPGGKLAVQGEDVVRFGLATDSLGLGSQVLRVSASADGVEIPVRTKLHVPYQFRLIAVTKSEAELQIDHGPDWTITAQPGRLERLDNASFRWVLPRDQADVQQERVDALITAKHKRGQRVQLRERIVLPSLKTPLRILSPIEGKHYAGGKIFVSGVTLPLAQVKVDQDEHIADENGAFSMVTSRATRTGAIRITAVAPNRKPAESRIQFRVASAKNRLSDIRKMRKAVAQSRKAHGAAPSYEVLRKGAHEDTFVTRGRVVAAHRTSPDSQAVIISLCKKKSRCPIWVDYSGLDYSKVGQKVDLVGRYIGMRAYDGVDGVRRVVPRIEAQVLVP